MLQGAVPVAGGRVGGEVASLAAEDWAAHQVAPPDRGRRVERGAEERAMSESGALQLPVPREPVARSSVPEGHSPEPAAR